MKLSIFRIPALWILSSISFIIVLHLIGVYIYEGGSFIGVPGGSVNIGMVGKAPDIPNPIMYGQNKHNDLILSFLFRGLLQYNDALGKYEGDIANCDITDISKVVCTIKEGGIWSDGTAIQGDDIISTFRAYKTDSPNEKVRLFLANVNIVSSGKKIEIQSKERNSLMLDILTYPIVRSDMLERIRTNRLSQEGYITSGTYTFLEKERNDEFGYDRITITRSEKNPGKGWLDKYNFLFFPDTSSLVRGADNVGIIIPQPQEDTLTLSPRFAPYEYTMYEYIGGFFNTDTTKKEIRKHMMLSLMSSIKDFALPGEKSLNTIFLKAKNPEGIKIEKSLSDIMRSEGYMKVQERLALLEQETGILTGSSIVYEDAKYVELPSKKIVQFSEVAVGELLISGKVPPFTESVRINDYTLKEFRPGNNRFSYKVSIKDDTMKEGKNIYTIRFTTSTGATLEGDTITLYYSNKTEMLNQYKKEVEDAYLQKLNTPERISERLKRIEEQKTVLKNLDPRYYYNGNGVPFTIKLAYIEEPKSLGIYAEKLAGALLTLSIKTDITPISTKSLNEMLETGKKNYDFIIVGFDANGKFSRIGQIFLSSEAKKGINFAKIQSKSLDTLFANLRIASTEEKRREIETSIQEYINKEAFFLPISSPIHRIYIDKNLKGIQYISPLQDITAIKEVIGSASIKEEYILSLDKKSILGFFGWIWEKVSG